MTLIYCRYEQDTCYSYSCGRCKALRSTAFESEYAQETCPFYKERGQRERELKKLKNYYK